MDDVPNSSSALPAALPTLDANLVGQRQTRQRDAILRVIQESSGPLSVPEIHQRARQALPQIGIATIYRTLKLLQESDQILVVILPSGETRYENTGLGHHDHFQCRHCHLVFDLADCPLHLDHGTALPGGFIVEDHEMTLYGTCPDCAPTTAAQSKTKHATTKHETTKTSIATSSENTAKPVEKKQRRAA